jgi:hypothetical protein
MGREGKERGDKGEGRGIWTLRCSRQIDAIDSLSDLPLTTLSSLNEGFSSLLKSTESMGAFMLLIDGFRLTGASMHLT